MEGRLATDKLSCSSNKRWASNHEVPAANRRTAIPKYRFCVRIIYHAVRLAPVSGSVSLPHPEN